MTCDHEWEERSMREDGLNWPIIHCRRCGDWGSSSTRWWTYDDKDVLPDGSITPP